MQIDWRLVHELYRQEGEEARQRGVPKSYSNRFTSRHRRRNWRLGWDKRDKELMR